MNIGHIITEFYIWLMVKYINVNCNFNTRSA
ncbi:hypothetical protein [Providencia phage PSTCR8lys]|nr:hypothetical protein [Providencia phage PSTCR8lys]